MDFFPTRIKWSPKNGFIFVTKKGEVLVGGYKQTSERYADLWADAFTHIDLPRTIGRVLMLGLAGGGAISAIRSAYPSARITAVEHDETMVEVANELKATDGVEVIVKDAEVALNDLQEDVDLILVDLFYILSPSPLLQQESFWGAIGRRLTPQGVVLVNVAGSPEYLWLPESLFAHTATWTYDTNTFGAFWN